MTTDKLEMLKRAHNQIMAATANIQDAHIDCSAVESLLLLPLIDTMHASEKRIRAFINAMEY